jgi:hypothetical protein
MRLEAAIDDCLAVLVSLRDVHLFDGVNFRDRFVRQMKCLQAATSLPHADHFVVCTCSASVRSWV